MAEHHSTGRTIGILALLAVLVAFALARFPEVRADLEQVTRFHRGHLPPSEATGNVSIGQPGNKHLRVLQPQPGAEAATAPAPEQPAAPAAVTPAPAAPAAPATTAPAAN